jgi:hypothetical protein
MDNDRVRRLKTTAVGEAKNLFGIFVYLWILLSLFSLHKALLLHQESLTYQQGFALINAFALAKVVLIGESLHIGDRFRSKPLIYTIIFKSALFAVIMFLFHFLEEIVIGLWRGKTLLQSIPLDDPTMGGGTLLGILMVCIIMFFVMAPFFAFLHLEKAIGPEKLRSILFGYKGSSEMSDGSSRGESMESSSTKQVSPPNGESVFVAAWYYYEKDGTVFGPEPADAISNLLKNNSINENTFVWHDSFGSKWRKVGDITLKS